jgi:hypothetical protein
MSRRLPPIQVPTDRILRTDRDGKIPSAAIPAAVAPTITLSGAVSGSGTTSIATTLDIASIPDGTPLLSDPVLFVQGGVVKKCALSVVKTLFGIL